MNDGCSQNKHAMALSALSWILACPRAPAPCGNRTEHADTFFFFDGRDVLGATLPQHFVYSSRYEPREDANMGVPHKPLAVHPSTPVELYAVWPGDTGDCFAVAV